MSKLLNKVLSNKPAPPETGGRITNETVAEHRERILAGGRKFKYPMQYTKHRVLWTSILIVIVAALSFLSFAFWQLYGVQNTDKFIYRLTQAIPAPVARVDGQWVRYSDYLRELRSSIHYFSTKEALNFNSDDGKRVLEYQKRLALDKSIEATLVAKLARENQVSATGAEVDEFVAKQINNNKLGLTEAAYSQVIRDYYDWSLDEYKDSIRRQLLRKKVAAKLDIDSRQKIDALHATLSTGADFAQIAKDNSEDDVSRNQGGDSGFFAMDSNDPNGLIAAAANLEVGQISTVIEGVDGFYIVKLLEKRGDELRLARIFIGYKVLNAKLVELKDKSEITEFIKVEPVASPES